MHVNHDVLLILKTDPALINISKTMFNQVWLEPTTKHQTLTDFSLTFTHTQEFETTQQHFPCAKAEDNVERWVCYTVNMNRIQTD